MKKVALAFALLVIIAISFSETDWFVPTNDTGGWGETVRVLVLDGKDRVVEDATVNISWRLNLVRGIVWTENKQTNSRGRVSFDISSIEHKKEDTDYTYSVWVRYKNTTSHQTFDVGDEYHKEKILRVKTYYAIFNVTDSDGKPVEVPLRVDGKYDVNVKNGFGRILLDEGQHQVVPKTYETSKKINFIINGDDERVNVGLKLYDVNVKVISDDGSPISGNVHVGSDVKKSDMSGWANFSNITTSKPEITVYYNRGKQTIQADIENSKKVVVIFDITPPIIQKVESEFKYDKLEVRAIIREENKYSSGLVGESASVDIFYTDSDGEQKKSPMFSIGKDFYEGEIPTSKDEDTIRYIIQARDASGNVVTNPITYIIPTDEKKETIYTPPPIEPINEMDDTVANVWGFALIIFLLVAIIAVFGYWYYNTKKAPSEEIRNIKQYTPIKKNTNRIKIDTKPPKIPSR